MKNSKIPSISSIFLDPACIVCTFFLNDGLANGRFANSENALIGNLSVNSLRSSYSNFDLMNLAFAIYC